MAEPSIDIQLIVREVLAELAKISECDTGNCPAPASPAKSEKPKVLAVRSPHELVVTARVVTTAELDDRLGGVRRVVVGPQAVVTPSVQDLLRNKNITLVRSEPSSDTSPNGACRLILTTLGKSFDPAGLIDALREDGIEADPRKSDCVVATSTELAGELGDAATLAVVLSSRPATAVCAANRLPGVRAVAATDPATTAKETALLGANLLAINPRTISLFLLKQLIRDFHRMGPRQCPGPDRLMNHLS